MTRRPQRCGAVIRNADLHLSWHWEIARHWEETADLNGCPDRPHHGVDCPGDACRYASLPAPEQDSA